MAKARGVAVRFAAAAAIALLCLVALQEQPAADGPGVALAQAGYNPGPMSQGFPVTFPAIGCSNTRSAAPICYFDTANIPLEPGTTISLSLLGGALQPPGEVIFTGYAADRHGDLCSPTSTGETSTLTLICPTGLDGLATGAVMISAVEAWISVSYQPEQDEGTASGPRDQYWALGWDVDYDSERLGGPRVALPAGWNLVGGMGGWNTAGNSSGGPGKTAATPDASPLLTYPPDAGAYEIVAPVSPMPPGLGAWVYLSSPATLPLNKLLALQYLSMPAPAGQWMMVGNPVPGPATISGADVAYVYDPGTASYQPASTLQPLQGAWVYSAAGGVVTIAETGLCESIQLPVCRESVSDSAAGS